MAGGVFGERRQQVTGAIGGQRIREEIARGVGEFQFGGVDHGRVIQAPLNNVDGVEDGGFLRGAAGFHGALFAALEDEIALRVVQRHFAFEQRDGGAAVLGGGQIELGAPDRPRNQRSVELKTGRLGAVEEITGA